MTERNLDASNLDATDPPDRPRLMLIAVLTATVLSAGTMLAVLVGRIDHRKPLVAAPAPAGPPSRFDTPQALVAYLDSRGLTCAQYETVESVRNAVGRGRCLVGADEVTVGVYAIHSDVEAQWATTPRDAPVYMALGDNWTVDGPEEWTRQVADVMGVKYRAQP